MIYDTIRIVNTNTKPSTREVSSIGLIRSEPGDVSILVSDDFTNTTNLQAMRADVRAGAFHEIPASAEKSFVIAPQGDSTSSVFRVSVMEPRELIDLSRIVDALIRLCFVNNVALDRFIGRDPLHVGIPCNTTDKSAMDLIGEAYLGSLECPSPRVG